MLHRRHVVIRVNVKRVIPCDDCHLTLTAGDDSRAARIVGP